MTQLSNLNIKICIKVYVLLISFLRFYLLMLVSKFLHYFHVFIMFCLQLNSQRVRLKSSRTGKRSSKKFQDWQGGLKSFQGLGCSSFWGRGQFPIMCHDTFPRNISCLCKKNLKFLYLSSNKLLDERSELILKCLQLTSFYC